MQQIQFPKMLSQGAGCGQGTMLLHSTFLIVPVIVALLVVAGCSLNQDGRAFLPSTDEWLLLLLH